MTGEILRTFIAIELDEPLRRALQSIQGKLARQVPPRSVKWVAPDGIHLTLKFLGETPADRVPEIQAALRAACTAVEPFEFSAEGRGCFPNCRRPKVIWVAVRDHGRALAALQTTIERHIAPLGWPTEHRAFSPHLTLGRIAKDADSQVQNAVGRAVEASVIEQIGSQWVTSITLIRSELRPAGAEYTPLAIAPLGGQKAGQP